MKVLVSACLLGTDCKYNGGNNLNEHLVEVIEKRGYEVIAVCPEMSGGLPAPRVPAEICDGEVINKEGVSVDAEFRKGAEIALKKALNEKVDFAILKAGSPSCGVGEIYDGTFTGRKIAGNGVFVTKLRESGIPVFSAEDFLENVN